MVLKLGIFPKVFHSFSFFLSSVCGKVIYVSCETTGLKNSGYNAFYRFLQSVHNIWGKYFKFNIR